MSAQIKDYFYVLLFIFTAFILIRGYSNQKKLIAKKSALKEQLKSLYHNQQSYLCYAAEYLGNNLIQFYGEPFGTSIRPEMKIFANSIGYPIKEVYADDKTPDKPDPEIRDGMANTAIVIETSSFDWNNFNRILKEESLVALKIE